MSFIAYFDVDESIPDFICLFHLFQCFDQLSDLVENINIGSDIEVLMNTKGSPKQPGEQILSTCYVSKQISENLEMDFQLLSNGFVKDFKRL